MQSHDLTLAAEEGLCGIWRYTYETWGFDQAEAYFDRIEACCEAVGRKQTQSRTLDGLPDGIRIHCCEHTTSSGWTGIGRSLSPSCTSGWISCGG